MHGKKERKREREIRENIKRPKVVLEDGVMSSVADENYQLMIVHM